MIADVIGSYLDTLEEREFDAPFMALLRSLGFYDIHFLHGSFEFGKDFIAKRTDEGAVVQYAFQTKAGDLGLTEWRTCQYQIDELRINALAHPSFNSQIPRKAIFVTTGRLIGGAGLQAHQYHEHLQRLGELDFVTWDRERLIELMVDTPEVGLAASTDGALLELLGHIDQRRIREDEIERFSRRWCGSTGTKTLQTSALEAAVVANRLRRHDRIDQACFVGLGLVRASWVEAHGKVPADQQALWSADTGRALFRHYALDLLGNCDEDLLDPLNVLHNDAASYITYPARCMRLIELLGLLTLLESESGDVLMNKTADFLAAFIEKNPGTVHPLSDRWAVSLIPPTLALVRSGHRQQVEPLLEQVVKWVADRYEAENFGLAGPNASTEEEVGQLLGGPFEHIQIERRAESYIATVVLDVAAVLEMGDLFTLARNEFLAVDIVLPVVEAPDTPTQYLVEGEGLCYTANMEFADAWAPIDGWKVAPHHRRTLTSYLPRIGRPWDLLAVSAVLRDRHFVEALRHFGSSGRGGQDRRTEIEQSSG
jgi:hypothetical protein